MARALALAAPLGAMSGCGGVADSALVVRVGDVAITKGTVDHWTNVVHRGGAFTGFRGAPRVGTPRQRALALLISSNWLLGEAAREHLPISEVAVEGALAERVQGVGEAKFRRRLRSTGQTLADLKLELRAELAQEAIRRAQARIASITTPKEVAAFYQSNPHRFDIPAERVVDLIENLPSPAAARALVKRIGAGRKFTQASRFHEIVLRNQARTTVHGKVQLVEAIFAARPGVVSQPISFDNGWTVFVVRRDVPAQPRTLAQVRGEVVEQLVLRRKRERAARFNREYRTRWTARTRCHPGYVAPGCAERRGVLGTYEDPFYDLGAATSAPTL
jgi:hypothetical protein